jgi:hypothetical protein
MVRLRLGFRTNCRSFGFALRAPPRMTGLWWAFGWGAGERRGPFELGRLRRSFDSRFALAQDDNEMWGARLRVTKRKAKWMRLRRDIEQTAGPSASHFVLRSG